MTVRPVQLLDKPISHPWVCAKCGSGNAREHYVDLGIDTEFTQLDAFTQVHLSEGAIYLCNLCITALIVDYLNKLFDFISNQRTGLDLESMKKVNELTVLHQEIESLRAIINKQAEDIRDLRQAELNQFMGTVVPVESSATDVIDTLLGKDANDTGRDHSDVKGDDQSPTGPVENADGDSAAVKSDAPQSSESNVGFANLLRGAAAGF